MALSTQERSNIIKLAVAMFNAAPGATHLAEMAAHFEANGHSLSGLAVALANTDSYKALNPTTQTAGQFAAAFLTPLGLQANAEAIAFVTSRFNAGMNKGQIAYESAVALNDSTAPVFADARVVLINKTTVAEYYSVTRAVVQTDIILLQSVISGVGSTDASVTAAKTAVDNAADPAPPADPAPTSTIFALTAGTDTLAGTAGADTFNGSLLDSLSPSDSIDGAGGSNVLNVLSSGAGLPTGVSILNVETFHLTTTSTAGYTINTSAFTGQTAFKLTASAQGAGAISINGTGAVSLTAGAATTGSIDIGAVTAPTGAVTVAQTITGAGNLTGGAITVKGGTTVQSTTTASNTDESGSTVTQGDVTVTGTSATTAVAVNQSAAVPALAAIVATTESAALVFNARGLLAGESVRIADLDYYATSDTTQAQLMDGFANLAADAWTNKVTSTGEYSGSLNGFSSGPSINGTITFTSTTPNAPVADLVEDDYANAIDPVVITQGIAPDSAVAGIGGIANGTVTITDVNAASLTAAGTLTSVSLNNFGAAMANSGALNSVTLAGKGGSFTQTSGALTTATATTEALILNGVSTTGAVDLGVVPTTVNLVSDVTANTLASLSASGATALNLSGSTALTLTAHTLAATAAITSTGSGAVTLVGALLAGQSYAGGAGVDTLTLAASGTRAVSTGAGDDFVTWGGALGAGGSVDAGEGTDTLSMTAEQAVTATASTALNASVAGFELLTLSALTNGATAINMAHAGGIKHLSIAGATVDTLTVTGAAAGFTLTQRGASSAAISVSLANGAGTADVLTLAFKSADGFTNAVKTTIAGVETLHIVTTDSSTTAANTAAIVTPITALDTSTVTVSGALGVSLLGGMTQTTLTSLDASGLTGTTVGGLTFTSGALAAAASIKGSAAGTNTVDFSAATMAVSYTGGSGMDSIKGGAGADTLLGGDGDDRFTYGQSGDLVSGTALADLIAGGAGTNTLVIGNNVGTQNTFQIDQAMSWSRMSGVSRMEAVGSFEAQYNLVLHDDAYEAGLRVVDLSADTSTSGGSNTINVAAETGSTNGYILTGSSYMDSLSGGAGNDTINGGAGSDTITGNQGADAIALGAGDRASDRVVYSAAGETASGLFTSGGSTAGMDIIGEAAVGDVIDLWDVFSATPTLGTAFLTAASAHNAALVQGTFDAVNAVFTAGADNDYMVQWADGTAVHSLILKDFGVAAPTLTVDVAQDWLTLAPVYNLINGTAGNDTLNGGAGFDVINGGAGKDTMNGGDGDDIFIIASSADHGTSNDGERIYGGNGFDVIRFTSTTPGETLTLSYWIDVEEIRIVAADGSDNATAGLGINADFLGVGPNIRMYGNAGNNTLVGNGDGINTIEGGAGNDSIVGGGYADVLVGQAGDDALNGGWGNDTLTGSAGVDTLTGGAGVDTFVFDASAGAATSGITVGDTLTDFVRGTDKLQFTGVAEQASAQQSAVQAAVTALAGGSTAAQIATAMAAANTTSLGVSFAVFSGSTYVYYETTGAGTGAAADDVFITLTGVTTLPAFAADVTA